MSAIADIHGGSTVGEAAAASASAIRVFTAHGIDYCCGGAVTLAEACARKRILLPALLAEIRDDATSTAPSDRNWDDESTSDVIAFVLSHHHAFLDREIPRLTALATKVARVHGVPEQAYLRELLREVSGLGATLTAHMREEEAKLFPAMLADNHHAVRPHLWRMFDDHTVVGEQLARIRALTCNFEAPEHACGSWNALWSGLRDLEAAIHEHVHIENNILAKRFTSACGDA